MITPDKRRHGAEEHLPPPLYGLILSSEKDGRTNTRMPTSSERNSSRIEHAYRILDEHCELTFLSSRKDKTEGPPAPVLYPQIMNSFEDKGRMGDILSALCACPAAAWLVTDCDLPYLEMETVTHLILNRNTEQAITAYISPEDSLPEPFCAIYEPRSREWLSSCMKKGFRSLHEAWIQTEPQIELLPGLRPHA